MGVSYENIHTLKNKYNLHILHGNIEVRSVYFFMKKLFFKPFTCHYWLDVLNMCDQYHLWITYRKNMHFYVKIYLFQDCISRVFLARRIMCFSYKIISNGLPNIYEFTIIEQ